jgi:PAS domain S-box-containing protein
MKQEKSKPFLFTGTNLSLRTTGLIVIAVPLTILLAVLITISLFEPQETQAEEFVDRTFQVQNDLLQVYTLVSNAANGVRYYLLAELSHEEFFEPFDVAQEELPAVLQNLDNLIIDTEQSMRLERIKPLVQTTLDELAEVRDRAFDTDAASTDAQLPSPDQISALLMPLQQELEEMDAREDALLDERIAQAAQARALNSWITIFGGALGILGSLAVMLLFSSSIVRRVRHLEANAYRLERGEPLAPLPMAADEIGRLGQALDGASTLLMQRERDLREAQAFLEHLIASGPVLIFRYTLNTGQCTYVSPNVERLLGYTTNKVLHTPDFFGAARVHPDDQESFTTQLQRLSDDGAITYSYRFQHQDKSYRWLQSVMRLEPDGNDEGESVLGYAMDITERKIAEEALKESEERFRLVVEGVQDYGIFALDPNGYVTSWNTGAERIKGYTADEIIGQHFSCFYPEETQNLFPMQELEQARSVGRTEDEGWRLRKDGSRFWANVVITALYDEAGNLRGFSKVSRDITERKRAAELRQEREAAERASKAKSEFLSRMSHELRTPLNAILGFAQLLDLDASDPKQQQNVGQILKAGQHLLGLINEVLDIARIEAGKLSLSIEPVRIGNMLQDTYDLIQPLATQYGIELCLKESPLHTRYVMADIQRLKQVLLNLLSNAVKYNSDHGSVTISCTESDTDRIRITIVDTGSGIPLDRLERLFTPFERLGAEQTNTEGTGLGLALSKGLVEAMSGTIGVESVMGQGSAFWVELPLVEGPLEQLARTNGLETVEEDGHDKHCTVLYIEDNLSNLTLVETIFQRRPDIKLLVAMQGRLGLTLARDHRPDLILLDLNLPDIPGDEVLRHLQDIPEMRKTPVIMISADATPGQIERLLAAGAHSYLTKPLNVRQFLEAVDEVLQVGKR